MTSAKLRCNCGKTDNFVPRWHKSEKWELTLNCCGCGTIYSLAQSDNENISVKNLVGDGFCNDPADA